MSYHLNIMDVLKAWFIPPSILSILITIIIILATINAGKKVYLDRGTPMFPKSIVILLIYLAVPLFLIGSVLGSGWQLNGDELLIKAPPSNVAINLKSSRMALISGSDSSQWAPEQRTMGIGLAGLATGSFTLRNGKNAVVFAYLPASEMMVLESKGNYYILNSPGVQALYKELMSSSVKVGVD